MAECDKIMRLGIYESSNMVNCEVLLYLSENITYNVYFDYETIEFDEMYDNFELNPIGTAGVVSGSIPKEYQDLKIL